MVGTVEFLRAAMSEFKFACPVCGQHITADSSISGSKLECPTCYRKIIVPQAPAAESKFILSAAQADRPRPQAEITSAGPKSRKSAWKSVAVAAGWVLVLGAAGTAAYVNRDRLIKLVNRESPPGQSPANSSGQEATGDAAAAAAANVVWTLDLAKAEVPGATAAGRIHDTAFLCERATLQGGALTLRKGRSGSSELGITIDLPVARTEDLAGKSYAVAADQSTGAPRVVLRWREAGQKSETQSVNDGYALKLEFGPVEGNHISGKIYICTPDTWKSAVAGTFRAEIRKPTPPKAKPEVAPYRPIGGA